LPTESLDQLKTILKSSSCWQCTGKGKFRWLQMEVTVRIKIAQSKGHCNKSSDSYALPKVCLKPRKETATRKASD